MVPTKILPDNTLLEQTFGYIAIAFLVQSVRAIIAVASSVKTLTDDRT
ncbi:hypothetical protein I8752_13190 [Nostocaceae cyanobacterium CENA369]|uniref:Uncharacterized protein n=1 Tax=Dendronalium phyllosphericum CENA369 TaxID=1725256 RepID=A0A8J7I0V6_9NOST|nr:hypothetical protein [Dendronalium phyllosphericum]MBH8573959.1 hypothetical protein [Dendronalium phyllosphericum CENA369]